MRCGLLLEDVAHIFALSTSHVSRIWITWVICLHQRLYLPYQFGQTESLLTQICQDVSEKNSVVLDCTGLFIERPSSCRAQPATFSLYKNHNTAKELI